MLSSNTVLYVVGLSVLILALKTLYNVTLHPLRSLHGPFLNSFSSIPYWLVELRGGQIHYVSKLHQQYGPIVRVSPNEVTFISSQAWTDIYGTGRNFPKDIRAYGRRPLDQVENLATERDRNIHAKLRRAYGPGFTERSLREQESLIAKFANGMIARMDKNMNADGKVNLVDMFQFTTFDITSELAFGEGMGLLEKGEYNWWINGVFSLLRFSAIGGILMKMSYPYDEYLMKPMLFLFKDGIIKQLSYTDKLMNQRLERGSQGKKDIHSYILDKDGTNKDLTIGDLHANALVIMIGGSETSATTLCGLFHYLSKNKAAYEKLKTEIRTTFKTSEDINLLDMAKMEYLNACLNEALRLYPPIPGGNLRIVPPEGATICEQWIPGGTTVSLHNYAAYHSEYNFTEPDSFVPERWLDSKDTKFANDDLKVAQPFSYGPRNCLGKALAWHQLRVLTTKTLWHYDVELLHESQDFMHQKVYVVWEKNPLMMKLTRRIK